MTKNIQEQNWSDMKKMIEGKLVLRQIDDYIEFKDWYWKMKYSRIGKEISIWGKKSQIVIKNNSLNSRMNNDIKHEKMKKFGERLGKNFKGDRKK